MDEQRIVVKLDFESFATKVCTGTWLDIGSHTLHVWYICLRFMCVMPAKIPYMDRMGLLTQV